MNRFASMKIFLCGFKKQENMCYTEVIRASKLLYLIFFNTNFTKWWKFGNEKLGRVLLRCQRTLSQCSRNRHSWNFWTVIHRYKILRGQILQVQMTSLQSTMCFVCHLSFCSFVDCDRVELCSVLRFLAV